MEKADALSVSINGVDSLVFCLPSMAFPCSCAVPCSADDLRGRPKMLPLRTLRVSLKARLTALDPKVNRRRTEPPV